MVIGPCPARRNQRHRKAAMVSNKPVTSGHHRRKIAAQPAPTISPKMN